MPFELKSIIAVAMLTLVAACAQQEEPMEEPMVMEEPHMDKL
ncbi:MAG: hypothetical protein ACR2OY_04015 [Boseongicola sp.]